MKRQTWIQLLFLAALILYGRATLQKTPHSAAEHEWEVVSANKRLVFANGDGIDVHGRRVAGNQSSPRERVAAFLLREGSLAQDVSFWREVERRLAPNHTIRLIGYCDGGGCARTLADPAQAVGFRVLLFGEMIDSQAVLNADAEGTFVLSIKQGKDEANRVRKIAWRTPDRKAEEIARSIVQ